MGQHPKIKMLGNSLDASEAWWKSSNSSRHVFLNRKKVETRFPHFDCFLPICITASNDANRTWQSDDVAALSRPRETLQQVNLLKIWSTETTDYVSKSTRGSGSIIGKILSISCAETVQLMRIWDSQYKISRVIGVSLVMIMLRLGTIEFWWGGQYAKYL